MNPLPVLNAIAGVLMVIGTGFLLARAGMVPVQVQMFLPRLITRVSLPAMLGTAFLPLDPATFPSLLRGTLLPFVSIFLGVAIAWVVGRLTRVQRKHFGLFCACFANPNTMYVGLPFCIALFGESCLPYVLIYYFANTFSFWTVGNALVSSDAPAETVHTGFGHTLRRLLAPPMVALLVGIFLWVFRIPVPSSILVAARSLGSLTTPLALLFIGMTLSGMDMRSAVKNRDAVIGVAGRLVLCPCIMWLLLRLVPTPPLMANIFLINPACPSSCRPPY